MRTVIVYESTFGNTEGIARLVAETLAEAGVEVCLTGIRAASPEDLVGCDLLIVGAPTHTFVPRQRSAGGAAPRRARAEARVALGARDWQALLDQAFPSRTTRPATMVFDARLSAVQALSGSPARYAARALRAQGFRLAGEPMSFEVTVAGGPPPTHEAERVRAWSLEMLRSESRPAPPPETIAP